MLHEYTDLIKELRTKDARFDSLCEKHDTLNESIDAGDFTSDIERDKLKKEKLRLKDEIYRLVLEYKESK